MLSASYLYAGYSDYFGGHGETDNDEYSEHLLYAFYGKDTSLRDIIDELVEDSWNGPAGESLPEDVTQDDVRKALLESMLNSRGRADYESGAIAECSAAWMADTDDDDDEDDYESPIFVVVLRYEKPEQPE